MAMNFKVFKDAETAATFTADILRKQLNNNPTSIVGLHLNQEEAPVLYALKKMSIVIALISVKFMYWITTRNNHIIKH